MKTVTSKKTVQSETSKLRETLINANVDGFTIEFINSLSLQELNTIIDNLQIVNKTDGKKAKRNISVDVLNYFLKKTGLDQMKVVASVDRSVVLVDYFVMVRRCLLVD